MGNLLGIPLPDVFGDPDALRDLARQLDGVAGDIGRLQSDLQGTVRGMTFEGPAGDAFRARADGLASALGAAQGDLHGLVGDVNAAAARIEAEQRALARALAERAASHSGGN